MVAILGFSKDQITEAVQAMYGAVAHNPTQHFHFPVGRAAALSLGYREAEIDAVPEAAVARFAGVGYPFRAGVIEPGQTVLDIGAGSGTDALIASRLVGPSGKVWALDITPHMVDRLRETVAQAGIGNVEVVQADAERIPLPDNSVDVVTSNGALNLVPNKRAAFSEIFRVLKPEGWVQIADIVIARPVPLGGRADPELWAECVVGASIDEDYLDNFRDSGFADVEVLGERDYFAESPSADTRRIANGLGARTMEIAMRRPAEAAAPASWHRALRRLDPRRLSRIGARGLWGAVAALAAVVACYGTLALVAILAALGLGLAVDEGLWATAIAGAAMLAAAATALNLRRHGQPWPMVGAVLAAALIIYVMFVSYSLALELIAFAALLGSVGLDLYLVYRAECLPKRTAERGGEASGAVAAGLGRQSPR